MAQRPASLQQEATDLRLSTSMAYEQDTGWKETELQPYGYDFICVERGFCEEL